VPAALAGIDLNKLLQSANRMQESCAPRVNVNENPGLWLGVLTAFFCQHKRDKNS
jgi:hypothetical protein